MNSSCIDCPDRHLGCQNTETCEKYREYKNKCEIIRSSRKKDSMFRTSYYGLKKSLWKNYPKTRKGEVLR